ncbi:hypothetical protein FH972_007334 [Carpinus fangiana]|uniref:Surfeit locus protein 2 n=1 Tax=Carpinus fangiana TaxID=176857 RepID=A0A5N6QW30_9ROSI|nr:hypothetical protein FH972_007334 [Carpinus fangiana]
MATSEEQGSKKEKEGTDLLGSPTFTELENGRFKCVETGHEVLAKDKESYSHSKRCRLGLIDFALSHHKPPLNMFKQDPISRSKLICKLTEDTINKSEEHIWKHINGKRFLNKLEEKEAEKITSNGTVEEQVRNLSDEDGDSEEGDFWMPPAGHRWDFDDGGDRWGSGSESGEESDEVDAMDGPAEEGGKETEELSTRAKRMSIEIGPSSFASRKKKSKKNDRD